MHTVNEHASLRDRYLGPSAARIADLLSAQQQVRCERGWFWTAAVCHDSEQDLMAFRQRPDDDGIDVRCRTAGCSQERITRRLESLIGESIRSASAPTSPPPVAPSRPSGDGRRRVFLLALLALLLAAPLALGQGAEVATLNAAGFGWVAWLVRRVSLERLRAVARRSRS